MNIQNEAYVSLTEAAELLGVCSVTLSRWIKKAKQHDRWHPIAIPLAQAKFFRRDEILAFGTGRR